MAEERIIDLSPTGALGDDDYTAVDSPTLGTRKVAPGALFAKGALAVDPFDPGVYLGVQVVATFNGEVGVVPMSDATGGLVGVLQAQLQQSVAGLSADAQAYADASQVAADLALQRADALPGVVLPDGSQSARAWQDAAQQTAQVSPVLAVKRLANVDFVDDGHGTRVYVLQPGDLFRLLLCLNTVAGVVDCPPQLFVGNAADGTEGAAWVHLVRAGTGTLTLRAQPNGGGGGGGTVTPVTVALKKAFGGKITALPADGIEPAQSLLAPSVPAASDRRVVVAVGAIYNRPGTPTAHVMTCSGTFGPTAGAKAPVTFTKLVAETSAGYFAAGDTNPVCLTVFEATLPDSVDVRDLAVTLDMGGAAHTDVVWAWEAYLTVAKDVGSRPAGGTVGSSGGAATADVTNSWNQPVSGLALYGAWGQGAAASPVTLGAGGAGAVDLAGKSSGSTALKDIAYLFGHAATTGAAQVATAHFSLAVEWAKYVVTYLPKPAGPVVGGSDVTLNQPAGLLGAQFRHAYVYPLTDGVTYYAAGT